MKKSEMICAGCIKFDGSDCRLAPKPMRIETPAEHWCAQGQWLEWSPKYQEHEPFFWGDWFSEYLN